MEILVGLPQSQTLMTHQRTENEQHMQQGSITLGYPGQANKQFSGPEIPQNITITLKQNNEHYFSE